MLEFNLLSFTSSHKNYRNRIVIPSFRFSYFVMKTVMFLVFDNHILVKFQNTYF